MPGRATLAVTSHVRPDAWRGGEGPVGLQNVGGYRYGMAMLDQPLFPGDRSRPNRKIQN